jgi:hypothetical protein
MSIGPMEMGLVICVCVVPIVVSGLATLVLTRIRRGRPR